MSNKNKTGNPSEEREPRFTESKEAIAYLNRFPDLEDALIGKPVEFANHIYALNESVDEWRDLYRAENETNQANDPTKLLEEIKALKIELNHKEGLVESLSSDLRNAARVLTDRAFESPKPAISDSARMRFEASKAAMQGIVSADQSGTFSNKSVVESSIELADALIAALYPPLGNSEELVNLGPLNELAESWMDLRDDGLKRNQEATKPDIQGFWRGRYSAWEDAANDLFQALDTIQPERVYTREEMEAAFDAGSIMDRDGCREFEFNSWLKEREAQNG